jgi:Pyridoxamine 5'-phosphate oxidase
MMAAKTAEKKVKPVSEKNLAGYGLAPIAWDRALERLEEEWKLQAPPEMGGVPEPHTHWLATTRPDGAPHVVPIGAVWNEGHFYFSSGAGTRKSRNLAKNPNCVMTLAAKGLDLVLEGEAAKVTMTQSSAASPRSSHPAAGLRRYAAAHFTTSSARRAPGRRPGTCTSSRLRPSSAWRLRSRTARRAGAFSGWQSAAQ